MSENEISNIVIGCAIDVHRGLGSGLMESVYENVLKYELEASGLEVAQQVIMPIVWKGVALPKAYVADLIVEDKLLLEIKSVSVLLPQHHMQLLTYLRLTEMKLGLLMNFNAPLIKDGIKRVVNGL